MCSGNCECVHNGYARSAVILLRETLERFYSAVLEWILATVTAASAQHNRPHRTKFKISKKRRRLRVDEEQRIFVSENENFIACHSFGTAPNSKCFHFILCLFTQLKCHVFSLPFSIYFIHCRLLGLSVVVCVATAALP